jgi:hypothetical protein
MKHLLQIFVLIGLIFTSVFGYAHMDEAAQAIPEPPVTNPHPPVTEQDKKRVAFAEMVLHNVLMRALPPNPPEHEPNGHNDSGSVAPLPFVPDPGLRLQLDEKCLQNPKCWSDNSKLRSYVYELQTKLGLLAEIRHTHIIPWSMQNFLKNQTSSTYQIPGKTELMSKPMPPQDMGVTKVGPDEYVMHTYGRFDKGSLWYHIDVIVSEDAQGKIKFQRFYIIQMPMDQENLPPGAVC